MCMWEKRARRRLSFIPYSNLLLQITILINCLSLAGLHWLVAWIDSKLKIQGAGWSKRGEDSLERDTEGELECLCEALTSQHLVSSAWAQLYVCWSVCFHASVEYQSVTTCLVIGSSKRKITHSLQCYCLLELSSDQTGARKIWANCLTVCVGVYFGMWGGEEEGHTRGTTQNFKTEWNYFII